MFAKWNEVAIDYLKANWEKYSASEIADKLSVLCDIYFTRNSVVGKAHRLKLASKDPLRVKVHLGTKGRVKSAAARAKLGLKPLRWQTIPRKPDVPLQWNGKIVCCGLPVDIVGLAEEPNKCHWPLWQAYDVFEDFRYCGNEKVAGCPYCAEHRAMGTYIITRRRNGKATHKFAAEAA